MSDQKEFCEKCGEMFPCGYAICPCMDNSNIDKNKNFIKLMNDKENIMSIEEKET